MRRSLSRIPTSSRRRRPPDVLQRENGANLHNSFTRGEAAALLQVSGRTVIHAARVLSEDSPAVLAGRLAVEQGRVTVSDASRVMDGPTEVQLRALANAVHGGGSQEPRRRGAWGEVPPAVVDVGGGRGYRRCWADPHGGLAGPARWVSPAGADMGGGAAVVVSGPERLRGWEAWHGVAGAPEPALTSAPAALRATESRYIPPFPSFFYGWGVICR